MAASFLTPLLKNPGGAYRLQNMRSGHVLAGHLMAAFDSKSRRRGLLGQDSLGEGSAMLIAPCNAVHTFFMRFPIDVTFVARNGRVLKVRRELRPWRLAAALRGFVAVELPAGTLDSSDTRPGDTLAIVPSENI